MSFLNCLPSKSPLFLSTPLGLNFTILFQIKSVSLGRASEFSALITCLSPYTKFLYYFFGVGSTNSSQMISEWHPYLWVGCCLVAVTFSLLIFPTQCETSTLLANCAEGHWGPNILSLMPLEYSFLPSMRGTQWRKRVPDLSPLLAWNTSSAAWSWERIKMLAPCHFWRINAVLDWELR